MTENHDEPKLNPLDAAGTDPPRSDQEADTAAEPVAGQPLLADAATGAAPPESKAADVDASNEDVPHHDDKADEGGAADDAADEAADEAPPVQEPLAAAEDGPDGAGEDTTSGDAIHPFVVEEWMYGTLEAIVFASSEPLSPSRAREVLGAELAVMDGREGKPEPSLGDIKAMFRTLRERWDDPTRTVGLGFRLVELDGGLCLRTAAAHARFIRRMQMGKPQRLSRASLETLAVIAYRQPVTKPQIEEVRGVDSSGALKALLDKKLVRVLGKAEEIGRPLLYGTTKTFLEFFGLNSLTDLPTLKELHELEHGVSEPVAETDDRPAVVMDLFNAEQVSAVSAETEQESTDALEALEQALGQAKDVAKRASSLVFGLEVEDEDGAPAVASPAAPVPPQAEETQDAASAPVDPAADEELKA